LIVNNGTIDRLFLNHVVVSEPEEQQRQQQTETITGKGNILETFGNVIK
jgi:hypothetical protein